MFEPIKPWEGVLDFWFGEDRETSWPPRELEKRWFAGGRAMDAEIEDRFGHLVEAALRNDLVDWEARPVARLALVLVLDQFTRHVYRGTADAYAGDHRAQTLVLESLAMQLDRELFPAGRVFFYMPLMHAENPELQEESLACFQRLHDEMPTEVAGKVAENLKHARQHRNIIARFGRFPHRNRVLGRENTPEEEAYLKDAPSYGQ